MTLKSMPVRLAVFLLFTPFTQSFADPAYESSQDFKHEISNISHYNTYNNSQLVRWKMGESSYIGETLVDGKKGLGLVTGGGTYVYSLNHEMVSLTIRF